LPLLLLRPKLSKLQPSSNAPGRQPGKSFSSFLRYRSATRTHEPPIIGGIQQFLAWVERAGYQQLEDIEPITVAAYIETLQRQAAPPTVKQHMAAIRMMFSLAYRKRSAGHESGPGSENREIFAD